MDLHVFSIPIPPPASLSIPSLWVFPVHQPWAFVSCIQPGLVICFTLDSILVSMLFSQNIPPSPSPTESQSLFCALFFKSQQLWQLMKCLRVDFLPSPPLRGTRVLVPAAGPRAYLPSWGVQTDLGKSLLVLGSPMFVETLSFIWQWSRLPALSHLKDTLGAQLKYTKACPLTQCHWLSWETPSLLRCRKLSCLCWVVR